MVHEFSSLGGESHAEVLRGVKLLPNPARETKASTRDFRSATVVVLSVRAAMSGRSNRGSVTQSSPAQKKNSAWHAGCNIADSPAFPMIVSLKHQPASPALRLRSPCTVLRRDATGRYFQLEQTNRRRASSTKPSVSNGTRLVLKPAVLKGPRGNAFVFSSHAYNIPPLNTSTRSKAQRHRRSPSRSAAELRLPGAP